MPSPAIAAVGDPETVSVYAAFGIGVHTVEAGDDAVAVLHRVTNDPDVTIILLTEPVYERAAELVESFRGSPTPVITLIPTVSGNRQIAFNQLRYAVRIAIGSEIV